MKKKKKILERRYFKLDHRINQTRKAFFFTRLPQKKRKKTLPNKRGWEGFPQKNSVPPWKKAPQKKKGKKFWSGRVVKIHLQKPVPFTFWKAQGRNFV